MKLRFQTKAHIDFTDLKRKMGGALLRFFYTRASAVPLLDSRINTVQC